MQFLGYRKWEYEGKTGYTLWFAQPYGVNGHGSEGVKKSLSVDAYNQCLAAGVNFDSYVGKDMPVKFDANGRIAEISPSK